MKKPSLTKAELNAVWQGLVYWGNHVAAECIAAGKNPAQYQEHKDIESARIKIDLLLRS